MDYKQLSDGFFKLLQNSHENIYGGVLSLQVKDAIVGAFSWILQIFSGQPC